MLVSVATQETRVGVRGVSYDILAAVSWVGGRGGHLTLMRLVRMLSVAPL